MKLTTEEFIKASLVATMTTPGDGQKVTNLVNWLAKELSSRDVPIYLAVSAFAVMIEGAREVGEEKLKGAENGLN